jgi:N-acetylglucosamine-6-phosphate deacetylase
MLPTDTANLHVRSRNVVLDGEPTDAVVELALVDGPTHVLVEVHAPDAVAHDADVVDVGERAIVPAPLDLHIHGAGGHVVPPGSDVAAIDAVLAGVVARAGWGGADTVAGLATPYEWVATLPVPQRPPADPVEHLAAAAAAIAEPGPHTWCRGLRIEGLFLNPARAGVWPPETFRAPDPALLTELHAAAADAGSELLVIDVAPELPGALELISRARELGIVASLAHTDATWEQARAAIDAGATLATHAWNAMRPVAHRDPGVVAAVLADPRVTCELICDGVHLHPGTVALSVAACGRGGWAAISDASPFAGAEPGDYEWAGTTVTHDGRALRDPEGHLAGSASLLDASFAELVATGVEPVDAALALGAVPRRVLDPTRTLGLAAGDPAWVAPTA